jgi:hypothetical protein
MKITRLTTYAVPPRWLFRTYNAFIQEQSLGIHCNIGNDLLEYLTDRSVFDYAAGFVTIPSGPGLGIDLNEDYVKERRSRAIGGATRCGDMRMDPSLSGEESMSRAERRRS